MIDKIDYESFSKAYFAMEDGKKQAQEAVEAQKEIASMIGAVWDQFYSCRP